VAQDAIDTQMDIQTGKKTAEQAWSDYRQSRGDAAYQTLVASLVPGALVGGVAAGGAVLDHMQQKKAGEVHAAVLDGLGKVAEQSKVRQRDPAAFAALMEEHLSGTASETVHVSGEALRTLYQSMGIDPFSFDGTSPDRSDPLFGWQPDMQEQMSQALATGGDVVFPTSQFVAQVAGTDSWTALKDDLRLSPDALTQREAAAQGEHGNVDLEHAGEQAAADIAQAEAAAAPVREVYDTIYGQLQGAGYTIDASRQIAGLWASRYASRAERKGTDALSEYQQFGARIEQQLPPELARYAAADHLDMLIHTARTFKGGGKTRPGVSLLEWIASRGGIEDHGGDLAAMGAKDWHKGKPGQRKLLRDPRSDLPGMFPTQNMLTNGNTPDAIALRAQEAGYLPADERPDIKQLQEAMDRELRGDPVYTIDDQSAWDGGVMRQEQAITELDDMLGQRGLSLESSNAEIKQAIRAYQDEALSGRTYAQSKLPEKINIDGVERHTINSKGKLIAASEEAIGNSGALDSNDARILYQDGPTSLNAWRLALDRAIDGSLDASRLIDVGQVSPVLSAMGMPRGKIYVAVEKIRKILDEHPEVTREMLRDLPKLMADPYAIFPSATEKGRLVVAVRAVDASGNPVIIPVMARAKNRGVQIASIYAKNSGFDWVAQQVASAKKTGKQVYLRKDLARTSVALEPQPSAPIAVGRPAKSERNILTRADIVKKLDQEARGSITFSSNRAIIRLFEGRNMSTLLHESGHLWLEELALDAALADAPEQIRQDYEALRHWWQSEGVILPDNGGIPTEAHELTARGFERYLMEGKAPSQGLRRVFETFRAWLMHLYKTVSGLDANFTDEVRGIFDRMLASDQEIEAVRDMDRLAPIFTAAQQAGMTDAEFASYQALSREARDQASAAMLDKMMAVVRKAQTKEWKDQERALRDEVTQFKNDRRDYRALALLRGRVVEGFDQPVKLNKAALVQQFGAEALSFLPHGIYANADGVHHDIVAERLGYQTGDQMVRELIGMEAEQRRMKAAGDKRSVKQAEIDTEVAQTIRARYGDPLSDGSIEDEARAALHSDAQMKVLATETMALARKAKKQPISAQAARDWARHVIAGKKVSDATALSRYLAAERKSATALQNAALTGKTDQAHFHSQQRLLNHALYMESRQARDDADAIVKRLQRYAKAKTLPSMDQEYLDQIHGLLEDVDLKRRTGPQIAERQAFAEWAKTKDEMGETILIPPRLANAQAQNFSKMTMEELRGLDDSIASVAHLGRQKKKLLLAKEERDFDEVVAEAQTTL
jgi:hypothetical protein